MSAPLLQVENLVKCYGDFCAVDHVSFEVREAEIFGLLGPNGAGKTSIIRAIMNIFAADEGRVSVLGRPPAEARALVGYLPEERGLYPKQKVVDVLVYLAELKGMARGAARERAMAWLERVGLGEWATHKVQDLSRGMQQKVQLVATVVHNPRLLILDEPFQGLDPVNVGVIKDLMRELIAEGITVMLSAHEMSLVEALCSRILLINRGQSVLYGDLDEIKRRYAPNSVRLRTSAPLENLPGVTNITRQDDIYTLTLNGADPQELLRYLVEQGIPIDFYESATAPLEEIFIAAVRGDTHV